MDRRDSESRGAAAPERAEGTEPAESAAEGDGRDRPDDKPDRPEDKRAQPDDKRAQPDDARREIAARRDPNRRDGPTRHEELDRSGEPIGEHRRSGRLLISQDLDKKMPGQPTMTEDRKLLEPTDRTAFLQTDTWRALPHPVRVRRGLRRARRGRPGDHGLRLGARRRGRSRVRHGAPDRAAARARGLRRHHRRRTGGDGGGQPRLPGGRRALGRVQHRAAPRAVASTRTSTSASSSGTSSPARPCS